MNLEHGYIETFCGVKILAAHPKPTDIFLTDIAVGLSRESRWNGHTKKMFTVAEHSMKVAEWLEEKYPGRKGLVLKGLMHDSTEAYLKDLASPIKALCPCYKQLEKIWQDAIAERFNIRTDAEEREKIKEADLAVLDWEYENKVKTNTGLFLTDKALADLFIHHALRLVAWPIAIMP